MTRIYHATLVSLAAGRAIGKGAEFHRIPPCMMQQGPSTAVRAVDRPPGVCFPILRWQQRLEIILC